MNNSDDKTDLYKSQEKIENDLNEKNEDINEKNEDINEKNEDIKEKNEDINEINEDINEKINNLNKENKDLKEKLKRYPFILEKDEQLMSIIISSRDEKIFYSLPCRSYNTINDIEKELYKAFPEYSKTKNIFLHNGKVINKFETFQKNHIKNGDILILTK